MQCYTQSSATARCAKLLKIIYLQKNEIIVTERKSFYKCGERSEAGDNVFTVSSPIAAIRVFCREFLV